jgi:hypothetical protein
MGSKSRANDHGLPDRRLPAGLMIMSRLEAGGPEEHERCWRWWAILQ